MTRIITWNTQGAAMKKINESWAKLHEKGRHHIFLIQEFGKPDAEDGEEKDVKQIYQSTFICQAVTQRNALNPRCSVGLLYECENVFKATHRRNIGFKDYSVIAKRPYLYADTKIPDGPTIVVATMHATARNPDVAMKEIYGVICLLNQRAADAKGHWILMGDFNLDAKDRRRQEMIAKYAHIQTPSESTQKSGGILDYALFSPGNPLYGECKMSTISFIGSQSDHDAVVLDVPYLLG